VLGTLETGQDGSDSIGVGQWNGDRARNFRTFAGDNTGNLDTQLDFIMHELNGSSGKKGAGAGSEAYAWNKLSNAQNVDDATAAMISYERPAGWSRQNPTNGHGWDNRISHANELMGVSGEAQAMAKAENRGAPSISQAQPITVATTEETKPESRNGILIQAYNKLTGSDVQVPDTILGADTGKLAKGFAGIGDFAKTLMDQDQAINKQIQANARSSGRSSTPVEMSFMTSGDPLRKKKKGGMSGLGGYLI
jgi:hypothetical protein